MWEKFDLLIDYVIKYSKKNSSKSNWFLERLKIGSWWQKDEYWKLIEQNTLVTNANNYQH